MADASFTGPPIVSVVMPVYNSEAYLADSIVSILAQTFTDCELICIDGGSRDGSLEVLRRH
jgi:glycosyltransferase involved in cell wall biosynthesis